MFYFEERGKDPKLNKLLTEDDRKLWLDIQNSLLSPRQEEPSMNKVAKMSKEGTPRQRTQQIVRMLVQFPAERSRNSASGLLAFTEVKVPTKAKTCKEDELDALLVIDRVNLGSLFDVSEQELLKLLKPIDEECPETFDPPKESDD